MSYAFIFFSQVLVLPPFQRQGHAAQLIQSFYNECYSKSEVLDVAGTQSTWYRLQYLVFIFYYIRTTIL